MHDVQKILIVRFSSMGDVLLATPLIRILRSRFPVAEIDFLVKSEFAELVRTNHHLSSTIEFHGGIPELRRLKKRIRQAHYDVILDIHGSLRSYYVRTFSRARSVSVVRKRAVARFMLVRFKRNLYQHAPPVAERYIETARTLGIRDDGKGLELFIPDETAFSVSSMLSKERLDRYDFVLGMAPGSRHKTKMWPQDRFVAVGTEAARAHNAKILLFGGISDAPLCEEIAASVNAGAGTATTLAGRLSFLETASVLDFCDVVLCNDTGIMHLAAARQRNVVALFGPTVREFGFFPWGTKAIVLEQPDLYCRPCTHIGSDVCPEGHFRCMRDTTPDRVLEAVSAMLTNTKILR